MNKQLLLALLAGGIATVATATVHAQANDALLNKLVSKGLLTKQEADELKTESDAGIDKSYRTKTGLPEWVTQFKIYGDVRGRFDHDTFENDDQGGPNVDRERFRYRLRVGATAAMKNNLELGFRIASGDADNTTQGGNPISGNQTARDNGSKKFVFVDLAYGKWTPIKNDHWTASASVGKIENPFVVSDMVFDPDYTPEGVALQLAYQLNAEHTFKLMGAAFVIDENNQGAITEDPMLLGGQVRWDAKWSKRIETTLGLGAFAISDSRTLLNGSVPNINAGNARNNTQFLDTNKTANPNFGRLVSDYTPIIADAALTYFFEAGKAYPGALPLKFSGSFMHNSGADDDNNAYEAGLQLGKAGKKGAWEVSARYKHLEKDATYEELVDDDFGGYYAATPAGYARSAGYNSGTNVRGVILKAAYSPYDALTLAVTYFATELIDNPSATVKEKDSGSGRLYLDAIWKF